MTDSRIIVYGFCFKLTDNYNGNHFAPNKQEQ